MRNYLAIAAAAAVALSSSLASVAPTTAMPMMPRAADTATNNVENVAYRGGHRGSRWIHRGHANWGGGGRHWRGGHGGRHYAYRHYRGHRHGGFYGPALGFGLGFGLGYGFGGYGPGYYGSYDPYYGSGYYAPRRTYRTYAGGDWRAACARRYRSFDWNSGTYLGYDGLRHRCRL